MIFGGLLFVLFIIYFMGWFWFDIIVVFFIVFVMGVVLLFFLIDGYWNIMEVEV